MKFAPASRLLRPSSLRAVPRATPTSRRFLSTAPPAQKSRGWKSAAARWGIAGAAVYYYSTSNIFAEEPGYAPPPVVHVEPEAENLLTIDAISEARKQKRLEEQKAIEAANAAATTAVDGEKTLPGSPEALEEEAGQQGAFNPETGEINWDCPCLGGMADGPCGPEFREAFSCFVYSTEDPKGIDCIDRFKGMQDCFRQHPDIYASELEGPDDDDDEPASQSPSQDQDPDHLATTPANADAPTPSLTKISPHLEGDKATNAKPETPSAVPAGSEKREKANAVAEQIKEPEPVSESQELVPKDVA